MKSENSSVKTNFIYNTLYQLLTIILPLITTPYISRKLGVEKIGYFSYSYSIAYYFAMFIMLGINNYGNRTIAKVREDKKKLSKNFCEIYMMQLFVSIFVVIIYIIYAIFFSNTLMTWILLIYIVSAVIDINWFYFGLEKFKLTVTRNSIIKILTTLMIFIFVRKNDDVYKYALITVFGLLSSNLILFGFLKKYINFVKVDFNDVKRHIKPNLLLFIPIVAISLYKMMDKIMIGALSNMNEVGFYENSEKIVQVPMAIINSLGTVMLPKMSNLVAKNEFTKTKYYLEISILFATFLASSICFGVIGVSNEFVPWYYGEGYEKCIKLFEFLMPSCIFLAVANVIRTQYLIPYNEDKIYIISIVLGAIINLIINSLLIPKFASIGAAIGTLVAEGTVCISQIYFVRKKIVNLKKYLLESIPFIIFGIIMMILLLSLNLNLNNNFLSMLCKIIIGTIIYIIFSVVYTSLIKQKVKEKKGE